MPRYLYICKECGEQFETKTREGVSCPNGCTAGHRRDYKAEGAKSTWHITRDVYAQSKKGKS